MYICQNCKEQAPPRVPQNKRITLERPREYAVRDGAGNIVAFSQGREVVKELTLCDGCALVWDETGKLPTRVRKPATRRKVQRKRPRRPKLFDLAQLIEQGVREAKHGAKCTCASCKKARRSAAAKRGVETRRLRREGRVA